MINDTPLESFSSLYNIIKKLRAPNGCPWDAEQTPDSIKENLIEESYECFDSIIEDDPKHICEELGDVYLLVTFLSIMYEEKSQFTTEQVLEGICEKLIRRHPHVFSDSKVSSSDEVLHQWEEIKNTVEGRASDPSVMDSVPKHFPPLLKAQKMQKKASKKGFDWNLIDDVFLKLTEEKSELEEAIKNKDQENIEEEIGDLLFTIVNLSRFLNVDASTALTKANNKFLKRFKYIEKYLKDNDMNFSDKTETELNSLWENAKKNIKEELP